MSAFIMGLAAKFSIFVFPTYRKQSLETSKYYGTYCLLCNVETESRIAMRVFYSVPFWRRLGFGVVKSSGLKRKQKV